MTDKKDEKVAKADDPEKVAQEAAKEAASRAEIDQEFRDEVAKASEKRDKALAKLDKKAGRGGNIAEIAWNETKAEDDPVYAATAFDHRAKLNTAVDAIRATGNADIVGLEAFEERVKELLEDEKAAVGTPSKVPAEAKANAEKGK